MPLTNRSIIEKGGFKIRKGFNFENMKDLKNIKFLLDKPGLPVAVPFNTNILRIALNLKE